MMKMYIWCLSYYSYNLIVKTRMKQSRLPVPLLTIPKVLSEFPTCPASSVLPVSKESRKELWKIWYFPGCLTNPHYQCRTWMLTRISILNIITRINGRYPRSPTHREIQRTSESNMSRWYHDTWPKPQHHGSSKTQGVRSIHVNIRRTHQSH
jgi:hypothetical protein